MLVIDSFAMTDSGDSSYRGNVLDKILLCVGLGVGHSLFLWHYVLAINFCFSDGQPPQTANYYLSALPYVLLKGVAEGVVWCMFVIPLLYNRPLKSSGIRLGITLGCVTLLQPFLAFAFAPIIEWYGIAIILSVPTAAVLLASAFMRLLTSPCRNLCANCSAELGDEFGVCRTCGDTTQHRRRSKQVKRIAQAGFAIVMGFVPLYWMSLRHTFGFSAFDFMIGIGQGALVIRFESLDTFGFFWWDFTFAPTTGFVNWPIATSQIAFIPLWIIAVPLFGACGVVWKWSKRQPEGYCQRCGYDLRELPCGRCPECGEPFVVGSTG